MLLKVSIARVEKESEMQYILLSLDGASALFSGQKLQFINRTFESVFVKSDSRFQRIFEQEYDYNQQIDSEEKVKEILEAKIFEAH